MTPHGTPTGYDDGCRGANCQFHGSKTEMTCTEAKTRHNGDWEYRKAVDAGTATAEKASYSKPKVARLVAETRAEKAARPAKVKAAPKPRGPRKPRAASTPKPIKHGTRYGADKGGCKTDCPNEAAGGISCIQARRMSNAKSKRKTRGYSERRKPEHGTESGYYSLKCRKDCPAEVTCTKVASAASYVRKQNAKAA